MRREEKVKGKSMTEREVLNEFPRRAGAGPSDRED